MGVTIEFLYENGEPIKSPANEELDEENTEAIFGLKVHDIIALGTGNKKRAYRILKIKRNYTSSEHPVQNNNNMHIDYIVEAI